MQAVVFVKSILDPEAPPGAIRFAGTMAAGVGVRHVLGPFEANALELAAQILDAGGRFSAVALGGPEQEAGLRKAFALGAERCLRLAAPAGHIDPHAAAREFAQAAQELGGADVLLFGRQAGDYDQAVTAGLVAGILGIPHVPLVQSLALEGGELRLRREIPGGYEELSIGAPLVVSATNGPGTLLRLPKVKDVMLANRRPIEERAAQIAPGGLELLSLQALAGGRGGRVQEGEAAALAQALLAEIRKALPGIGGGAA